MNPIQFTALYVFVLTLCIIVLSILHTYSFPTYLKSLQMDVMYSSLSFMGLILIYVMIELVRCCSPRRWGLKRAGFYERRRQQQSSAEYADLNDSQENEILHGRPRLHIEDVWTLVYGVGSVYFMLNYVLLCHNAVCVVCMGAGLLFIVTHEVVTSGWVVLTTYNMVYYLAAFVAIVGVLLHSAQNGFMDFVTLITIQPNFFEHLFGIVFPFTLTAFLVMLRGSQKYSLGGIYELCEFGIPFACIVSTLVFSCMYNLQGPDERELWTYMTRNMFLTMALSPVPLFGIILLVMQAVLKRHTVDVLISLAMAWGIVNLIEDHMYSPTKPYEHDVGTIILAVVALFIRLTLDTTLIIQPTAEDYPMNSVTLPEQVVRRGAEKTRGGMTTVLEEEDELTAQV
jgi:hypothetical protein